MVNRVILIGNLGADPEIRSLESGVSVARLRIATSENYKDKNTNEWKELTEWHTVTMWRGLADRAENSLRKGMQVYIEGKLSTRKWTDQEGKERYSTEVVANYLRIVNRREAAEMGNTGGMSNPQTSTNQASPQVETTAPTEEMTDDLPF
jgi:single-strand DNA-binding protein